MGMRNKSTRWPVAAGVLVSGAVAGVYWNPALTAPVQSAEAPATAREDDAGVRAPQRAEGTLALGELKLNSKPNEPFDAEIELLVSTGYELARLQVGMANNAQFVRYGLAPPANLSDFHFAVTRNGDGRAVIKVTSSSPVPARSVTLLVEVVSDPVRLLREYTILRDP